MTRAHEYSTELQWLGNRGAGTAGYRSYDRTHELRVDGKPPLPGSSDPAFLGDRARYNPEELLVGALSACHMLMYLHLCSDSGVMVVGYEDTARGRMEETEDGGGRFTEVVLRPRVTITHDSDAERAEALHERAHQLCFIASSVSFPVHCEAEIRFGAE